MYNKIKWLYEKGFHKIMKIQYKLGSLKSFQPKRK